MADLFPMLPPWFNRLLVLSVVWFGLLVIGRGWKRRTIEVPHCPRCRYNLTGAPTEACPECGHVPKHDHLRYFGPRQRWIMLLGIVIVLALPVYVAQYRMRSEGWDYYLRLQPLYALFGQRHLATVNRGPFTVRFYEDRRTAMQYPVIAPGNVQLDADFALYAWQILQSGDLNGNALPDIVLTAHDGGNTDTYRVYELIDGQATLLLEATGSPGGIVDDDGDGVFHFVGDVERQPYDQQWVRIPLEANAKPVEIDPPSRALP